MKNIFLFIVILLIATGCHYGETREQKPDNFINIGRKEKIKSKILDEEREIWVYVPPYSVKSNKKLPVLYLLDGDAHFHSVSGLIQILGTGINGTNLVPEMIVVAIPNTDRTRDLTPSNSDEVEGKFEPRFKSSGGGNKFLKFIQTELIPYVESAYPASQYRTLVGHSFGGIATINALYTMPETFDSYVAIDPSLWWDKQLLLKRADSFFSSKNLSDKYLYLAQANTLQNGETTNFHFGSITDYVKVLESPKNTSGIHWASKYYPDDSHSSVPFISEYDGLRFIFKDFYPDYDKIGKDPQLLEKNFAQFKMSAPQGIVNEFGYTAMNNKDFALAEKYFKMNVDAYPESSNAYDSMGELLLNKGDTVAAVQMYEKSLKLDSNNDNARKVLNDLMAWRSRNK